MAEAPTAQTEVAVRVAVAASVTVMVWEPEVRRVAANGWTPWSAGAKA